MRTAFRASDKLIPYNRRAKLIQVSEDVVQQVCQKQTAIMRRRPSDEIDFVASFVVDGAGLLENKWQTVLAQDQVAVRVAGIFCHQSPMVNITASGNQSHPTLTNRCELADLLVLHSHRRSDHKVFWRGTLMQTKSSTRDRIVPEEPQLWLYEDWPDFVIAASGFGNGVRDFNRDRRSGLYALVSSNRWVVLPASNPLVANSMGSSRLGVFLVNMLYDMDPAQPGRRSRHGRPVYRNSKYDWSPTIWELVRVTGQKALSHKGKTRGLYHSDLSRLGGGVLQMMVEDDGHRMTVPPGSRPLEADEGKREGIGILIVETRSEVDLH
jgi:hypothetical protein